VEISALLMERFYYKHMLSKKIAVEKIIKGAVEKNVPS
jgi:hypothetical protein